MPIRWFVAAGMWLSGAACLQAGDAELPADPQAEQALLRWAGSEFKIKRTPHYLIAYNTSSEAMEGLVVRVEHTYNAVYRFCEANQIEVDRPNQRLEIVFFDQRRWYDHHARQIGFNPEGTYGVYNEASNRSAFVNMLNDPELVALEKGIGRAQRDLDQLVKQIDRMRQGHHTLIEVQLSDGRRIVGTANEVEKEAVEPARQALRSLDARRKSFSARINQTVVQHEVAHQVLFNAGVHQRGASNPKWVAEGLATQFETPPNRRGTGIGTTNQLRLRDFRKAVGQGRDRRRLMGSDLVAAFQAGRLFPLTKLISDPGLFQQRGPAGTQVYASAWALTHYLQRRHSDSLTAYLGALADRTAGTAVSADQELRLFESHFGPLDDAFVRRWGNFIFSLPYRPPEVKF